MQLFRNEIPFTLIRIWFGESRGEEETLPGQSMMMNNGSVETISLVNIFCFARSLHIISMPLKEGIARILF